MRNPPPGRLVDIGTHRLHLLCKGTGQPTVVFDSALGGSSLSWSLVHPSVAEVTQACAYDRAGFGWSEAGPLPRTAGRIADELSELLRTAALPGPYVFVGHSYGGLVMRLLAARHPERAAGLVLIEPAMEDEWIHPSEEKQALIARGVRLCTYGAWAARHGLARLVSGLVSVGALGAARTLVGAISRGGLGREDEAILAPIWKLPPEVRRVLKQMWIERRFFDALGSQIETISESARQVVVEASGDYGDLPLAVVTSEAANDRRHQFDRALARLSSRGRHIIARDSGHWVPLDSPRTIIEAVAAVVADARNNSRNPRNPS
jgi:pimeloyl-ACP methyl ester carboxylesterase